MLLGIAHSIPFVQSITSFSWETHKDALPKFFSLWILSVLPIIFAALLFPLEQSVDLWGRANAAFSATDQFIYAVSFLSPMLYMLYEKYVRQRRYIASGKRSPDMVGPAPRGFGYILFIALLLFVFTAFAFGASKVQQADQTGTAIEGYLATGAIGVYAYSIFCWYITILMSISMDFPDFVAKTRQSENDMTDAFSKRLAEKDGRQ